MNSEGAKTFFRSLKYAVKTINDDFLEVQKKLHIPDCDLSDHSSARKVNELSADLNKFQEDADHLVTNLKKDNDHFACYYGHMEELVSEMEEKTSSIENYVKQFGYKNAGEVSSNIEVKGDHLSVGNQDFETPRRPVVKERNLNEKFEDICGKTPMLVEHDVTSKLQLRMNENAISCSPSMIVAKPLNNNVERIKINESANNFATPGVEDRTPDQSLLIDINSNLKQALQEHLTPEAPLDSTENLKDQPKKSEITPDLPLAATNLKKKTEEPKTPELTLNYEFYRNNC